MKKKLNFQNENETKFSFKRMTSKMMNYVRGGGDPTPQGNKGGAGGSDACACGCIPPKKWSNLNNKNVGFKYPTFLLKTKYLSFRKKILIKKEFQATNIYHMHSLKTMQLFGIDFSPHY